MAVSEAYHDTLCVRPLVSIHRNELVAKKNRNPMRLCRVNERL